MNDPTQNEPTIEGFRLVFRVLIDQRIEIGAIHAVLAEQGLVTAQTLDAARARLREQSHDVLAQLDATPPDTLAQLLRRFQGDTIH